MKLKLTTLFLTTLALWLAGCAATPELHFVHMTDPQLGFADYQAEKERLTTAIRQINAESASRRDSFVLITGDFTNVPDAQSLKDFQSALAGLQIPYVLVPGNHDINQSPESTAAYHENFGADYHSVDFGPYRLLVLNTDLLKTPQERTPQMQVWFRNALRQGREEGKLLIVAGHCPIFIRSADEADDPYYNLPQPMRQQMLDLFTEYGVIAYFGGHTHTRVDSAFGDMRFLHSETTSVNFDQAPTGYRVVDLEERQVQDAFRPVQ